jgi:hypothetical protein
MVTDAARTPGIQRVTRPARALIGWMRESAALGLLANHPDLGSDDDRLRVIRSAQASMKARPVAGEQLNVVSEPPESLAEYVRELMAHGVMDQFKAEGWTVRMADLRRVCSVQPSVFLDHAADRTRTAAADDIEGLAQITLPTNQDATEFSRSYDEARQRFVLTSRNPNFRVVGSITTPMAVKGQGGLAVGFVVVTAPSLLQVAKYRGRYVLRDGNHRALGLLANGIHTVPVLYREYHEFDTMNLSSGLFQPRVFLGERPPLLVDYLDDTVATTVFMAAMQRVVIVEAIETSVMG